MKSVHASFKIDRSYFNDYYRDWTSNTARWKLLLLPTSVIIFLIGVFTAIYFPDYRALSGVLIAIGIIETIDLSTKKARWIRTASNINDFNCDVTLNASDDGVRLTTKDAESLIKWSGFSSHKATLNGIFLKPDKRNSIYIPNSAWKDSEGRKILLAHLEETDQDAAANP